MVPNTQARFATRFLLFGEITLGWVSASWAVSGLWGAGEWWKTFNTGGVSWWAWGLLSVGLAQFGIAGVELVKGRAWVDETLRLVSEARHIIGVIAGITWISMAAHFFQTYPIFAPAILMQALMLVVGNSIVAINNKRLSVLLDPKIPTEQLRARLLKSRAEGKMVL